MSSLPMPLPSAQVVLYARVSKEEQASAEHFSLEAQVDEMQEFARAQAWTVKSVFLDDVSGQRVRRPGLDGVFALAESEGFDILLVHELSRLSRASVYDTLGIFQRLGRHNIGFASVKEPNFDFADPSKRFFLILLAALNQYYVDLVRVHTQKGKRERARQGLTNASIPPFGYAHAGDKQKPLQVVPEEAHLVQRIFATYAEGELSHLAIAEQLNRAGYRTRPTKTHPEGRPFAKAYIARILQNRFYTGKIVYGTRGDHEESELFPGQHDALVTEALWETCQNVRATRRSNSRAAQQPYRVYLLGQLARCDGCGRKLRSQSTATTSYYRELSNQKGYTDCPHRKTGTPAAPVDAMLHVLMAHLHLPAAWLEDAEAHLRAAPDEAPGELRQARQQLEAERRRLKMMKVRGEFDEDPQLYQREQTRIRQALERLPTPDELENLRTVLPLVADLPATWRGATREERRALARLILQAVWVDVPNGRLTGVQPHPLFLPLFRQVAGLEERALGTFVPRWTQAQWAQLENSQVIHLSAPAKLQEGKPWGAPFLSQELPQANPHPGLHHALLQAQQTMQAAGQALEKLVFVGADTAGAYPWQPARWVDATADICTAEDLCARPPESVDVLVTRGREPLTWAASVWPQLTPGGVWYGQAFLPQEMPANWLYRVLPELWAWSMEATPSLHASYQLLQQAGFEVKAIRQVYAHTLTLSHAETLLRETWPLTFPAALQATGLARLATLCETHGAAYLLDSETVCVSFWAQKPLEQS